MVRSRRVTLRDVADQVGLSVNTVSRALAGKSQVSEPTRHTVHTEAKRLGYVPNSHARSLVSGRTMVIGLIITNPSNPFYATLISAIEQHCRSLGYSVLLLVTEESAPNESEAIEQLLTYGVDGVIGIPVQDSTDAWSDLANADIPVVFVSRDVPELGFDFVGIDAEHALTDAVARLAAHAERVWLFEEDLNISTTTARVNGFRNALHNARIDEQRSLVLKVPTNRTAGAALPWRPDDAYQLAANLITANNHPDLIVTGNDYFALGILRALRQCGLEVPRDVMLLGYGDHPFAAYLDPSLTTVRLPAHDIGTAAVEYLLGRIADPTTERQTSQLQPKLALRDSTARPADQPD